MNKPSFRGPLALLAFVLGTGYCAGQSVLSAGGGTNDTGPTRITYTIGEPVITTVGSGASQLTQGFNQPWVDINTAVDDPGIGENTISVYPNPVRHVLNIALSEDPADHRYELFDAVGKRVLDGRVEGTITELDMEPYASGGYFLRVFGPDDSFLRSFKISVTH
ncbi:MAG: T9SS type A sorting domain-containing protein [Flavobacteriales bacterium]|nr:T9SS type A sorting domain-containing protein [Flavobacteriales bacterium]